MNVFQRIMKYVALFIAVMALNAYNDTKMTFNVDKADSVVHKEIFGVLMERLGNQWDGNGAIWVGTNSQTANTDGMRQSVIDGFKECGVGAAEWPGGCAANNYVWSDKKIPPAKLE
jgi:alpha-L-arabinofuranosidase